MVFKRNNIQKPKPKPKKKKPAKHGHKGGGLLYKPDLFPQQAYIACSELGAFDFELAKLFGVSIECIRIWKREHEEFGAQVNKGVIEYGNQICVLNLRKRVEGFTYPEVKTEEITLVQGRGKNKIALPAIKTTTTIKYVIPDVGALAFWLKNKMRDDWKDYKAVEIGNLDGKSLDIRVTVEDDD